jgi:hypothetical protein
LNLKHLVKDLNNDLRRGKRSKKILTEKEMEQIVEDMYKYQDKIEQYEVINKISKTL